MKYWIVIAVLLGYGLSGHQAMATDMKIAYVDVTSAMENTKTYHIGLDHLKGLQEAKKKELDALRSKITKLDKDLFNQSMTMSPDALSRKQQQLNDIKKEFKRKMQDVREALMLEKNRLERGLFTRFYKEVRAYGEEHGFDLILSKKPSVIYGNPSHDITADITLRLDKSVK